jgi:hypothetical protein
MTPMSIHVAIAPTATTVIAVEPAAATVRRAIPEISSAQPCDPTSTVTGRSSGDAWRWPARRQIRRADHDDSGRPAGVVDADMQAQRTVGLGEDHRCHLVGLAVLAHHELEPRVTDQSDEDVP